MDYGTKLFSSYIPELAFTFVDTSFIRMHIKFLQYLYKIHNISDDTNTSRVYQTQ